MAAPTQQPETKTPERERLAEPMPLAECIGELLDQWAEDWS